MKPFTARFFGDRLAPDGSSVAANFERWFGSSVVVDQAGSPLTLFHGTNSVFEGFDPEHSREDRTVFLSSDPRIAGDFAVYRTVWGGANVVPVFVMAERLLTIEGRFRPIREVENDTPLEGMRYGETPRCFARRLGFDGILLKDVTDDVGPQMPRPGDVYQLFESAQMKSVHGNSGLFDSTSLDLADAHAWESEACEPALRDRLRVWQFA